MRTANSQYDQHNVKVVDAMNIGDTLREKYPFEVIKVSLTGPDGAKTPHFGLFRSDSFECVGNAVKKNYVPHTVDDVVTLAEAAAGAFGTNVAIHATWNKGHHITVAPTVEYRKTIFGTADELYPRMVIRAGYDGTCYIGSLGMYRSVCKNLLIIEAAGTVVSARIKHTGKLRGKLDSLRCQFSQLVESWNNVHETAQQMSVNSGISIPKFLDQVFVPVAGASKLAERRSEERHRAIVSRILRERKTIHGGFGDTDKATAWELFNGVQGYIQHDRKYQGAVTEMDRAIRSLDDKTVRRALELALAS